MQARTQIKINEINSCTHKHWIEHNNDREYGYKNCCVCSECGVGCGEYLNADYVKEVQ